jgi:hypothetical protein
MYQKEYSIGEKVIVCEDCAIEALLFNDIVEITEIFDEKYRVSDGQGWVYYDSNIYDIEQAIYELCDYRRDISARLKFLRKIYRKKKK